MMAMEFPLFSPTRRRSLNSSPCLIEELVHVEKELSVIVCSRPQGEIVHYPVVESEFHPTANQVEYVLCPARISGEVAKKAVEVALKTAKAYGQIGLLAVELLTPEGDILVNEVAPRPTTVDTIALSFPPVNSNNTFAQS